MNALRVFVLCVVCPVVAVAADVDVFPMQKGDAWTYSGTVRWTPLNSRRARTAPITWKSEVVNTIERGNLRAALLKGFVSDLAWWDPDSGKTPRDWLLVRWEDRYYLLKDRDATDVFSQLQKSGGDPTQPVQAVLKENIFFVLPLKVGGKYCAASQPPRDDTGYCWYVEASRPLLSKIPGVPLKRYREYSIAYRTLPEHEIVGLTPGVGITSYRFAHHGTVAEADVRLVGVEHAK
jgi:hypothetical protein